MLAAIALARGSCPVVARWPVSKSAENLHDASAIVPLIKRFVAEGAGDPPPVAIPESYIPVVDELTPSIALQWP